MLDPVTELTVVEEEPLLGTDLLEVKPVELDGVAELTLDEL